MWRRCALSYVSNYICAGLYYIPYISMIWSQNCRIVCRLLYMYYVEVIRGGEICFYLYRPSSLFIGIFNSPPCYFFPLLDDSDIQDVFSSDSVFHIALRPLVGHSLGFTYYSL